MPTINFPANPIVGQTYDFDSKRYRFDGIKWTTIKYAGDTAVSLMDAHKSGEKEHSVSAIDWQGPIGHRNLLINGGMEVNQRGAGGSNILDAYGLDRWLIRGRIDVFNEQGSPIPAGRSLRLTCIDSATATYVRQIVENTTLWHIQGGDELTASAWVFATKPQTITISAYETDTENVYSSAQLVSTKNIPVVSGWQHIKHTFAVTNRIKKGLLLHFGLTAAAVGDSANFTAMQLERGSVATPFEHRPYGNELSMCQRYYESGYFYSTGYVGAAPGQVLNPIVFKSVKRRVPTVTLTGLTHANCSGANASVTKADCAWVQVTGSAAAPAYAHGNYAADAEIY